MQELSKKEMQKPVFGWQLMKQFCKRKIQLIQEE
jgi:hypothetical protein